MREVQYKDIVDIAVRLARHNFIDETLVLMPAWVSPVKGWERCTLGPKLRRQAAAILKHECDAPAWLVRELAEDGRKARRKQRLKNEPEAEPEEPEWMKAVAPRGDAGESRRAGKEKSVPAPIALAYCLLFSGRGEACGFDAAPRRCLPASAGKIGQTRHATGPPPSGEAVRRRDICLWTLAGGHSLKPVEGLWQPKSVFREPLKTLISKFWSRSDLLARFYNSYTATSYKINCQSLPSPKLRSQWFS